MDSTTALIVDNIDKGCLKRKNLEIKNSMTKAVLSIANESFYDTSINDHDKYQKDYLNIIKIERMKFEFLIFNLDYCCELEWELNKNI